ncbi:MAG: hypothetical protein NT131_06100 [Methanomassiliicoccales archaeon]|nr:hypothetical protein [Methanomassiliicoccales archaeon]
MSWQWLRRLVHISAPLFCVYYYLPDLLLPGLAKTEGLLLVMLFALGFEALRLIFRIKVPGMRSYEFDRPSAASYTAVALTFAFLFFPIELVLPVLIGMGWVDPLIGKLRHNGSKMNPALPIAAYFFIMLLGLGYFYGLTFPVLISAALIAPIAVYLEAIRFRFIDDDFVLIVVPLLLLGLTFGQLPF